jgi:hypothetical protein
MSPIEVSPLFVGKSFQTALWMSERAANAIENECDNSEACLKKLKMLAQGGFKNYEGGEGVHIRFESDAGAYRIRYKHSSLFRIIGFYTTEDKAEFIAIDAFNKPPKNKYPTNLWNRIVEVGSIRTAGAWLRKVEQ